MTDPTNTLNVNEDRAQSITWNDILREMLFDPVPPSVVEAAKNAYQQRKEQ